MNRLLKIAIQVTNKSPFDRYHYGAVIFSGGKVITSAYNDLDYFSHAETSAVKKLCERGSLQEKIQT